MDRQEWVQAFAEAVAERGGRCYYVGGCVRDRLMGIPNKDIDVEVHGISPTHLEEILDLLGERLEFGKSFGIYSMKGYDVDIALPRSEEALGRGHRDFRIDVDPFIGPEKAASRRDFTVNALMQDVLNGEIFDFFGGRDDLENKILRHVHDAHFAEDPLRVLRAAQFAARFGFTVAPDTVALCQKMDLTALSKERVFEELKKALLKSEKPSVFFYTLKEMEQLSYWFPEVEALIGVPQNSKYHLEGDVFVHTMMVLDEAAKLRGSAKEPFYFMLSALAHDFGKVAALEIDEEGYAHAYDHEHLGLPAAERFCTRLTSEQQLSKYLLNMVKLHMSPNSMSAKGASVRSFNHLFDSAVSPEDLLLLCYADSKGMIAPFPYVCHLPSQRERLATYYEYLSRPYVTGKDLIDAGLEPNVHFSEILNYAHKLRLAGIEKSVALKQTLGYARSTYRMTAKNKNE